MTKIYLLIICLMMPLGIILAQTPQAINYQGVARDNSGNVLANQAISLKLSILSGSASGSSVYVETHAKTTDDFGLFSLKIGQGSIVSGSFSTISWGTNSYYLKIEIDPAGGTAYQLVGTNQFVAVPYALYAGQSSNGWDLTGNTGTVDGVNFIGTTDNKPLNFKVNNQKSGRIDTVGTAFFGYKAGKNNTSTTSTGVGYKALSLNTTGFQNTAVGHAALALNISSAYNTATGYHALYANTDGNYNTAYGTDALAGNRSGFSNTAVGYQALYSQSYDVPGGWAAENVAIGYYSMYSNQPTSTSNGIKNTAVGSGSLNSNTTGYGNVALGHSALVANQIGYNNTAIGNNALYTNYNGNNNIALGYYAGYYNTILSNRGFINNYNTGSLANDTTKSLVYMVFDPTPANQKFVVNGDLLVPGIGANVGIGTSSPSALFHLKNGHIKSEQTTAPTIAVTTANGITAAAITANSSDTKGNITTTGTNSGTANTALTLTFNAAYNIAPTVIITAANDAARQCTWYVTSTTTTFVLYIRGAFATPSFNFMVIE